MAKNGENKNGKTENPVREMNRLRENIKAAMLRNLDGKDKEEIEFLLKRL